MNVIAWFSPNLGNLVIGKFYQIKVSSSCEIYDSSCHVYPDVVFENGKFSNFAGKIIKVLEPTIPSTRYNVMLLEKHAFPNSYRTPAIKCLFDDCIGWMLATSSYRFRQINDGDSI